MAEYTPTTEEMRNSWIDYMTTEGDGWDGLSEEESQARWDRWLAARDREVAAKALRDAAEQIRHKQHPESVRQMFNARADRIEKGADHDPR